MPGGRDLAQHLQEVRLCLLSSGRKRGRAVAGGDCSLRQRHQPWSNLHTPSTQRRYDAGGQMKGAQLRHRQEIICCVQMHNLHRVPRAGESPQIIQPAEAAGATATNCEQLLHSARNTLQHCPILLLLSEFEPDGRDT